MDRYVKGAEHRWCEIPAPFVKERIAMWQPNCSTIGIKSTTADCALDSTPVVEQCVLWQDCAITRCYIVT